MKSALHITMSAAIFFFSHLVLAAQVHDARINEENQTIELDISYSGGCVEHKFELKVRNCGRTSPMSCVAELIDKSFDSCRQIIETTIEIPAEKYIDKTALINLVILGSEKTAVQLPFLR